jgi:hypothetical protein
MTKRQGENLEQRDAKRRSESSRDDSRTPLTVLANRLPLYIDANQQWQQSPGGLAKVLCSVLTAPNDLWIGFSGRGSSTDADKRTALPSGATGAKCIELHIEEKDYKNYYEGFCNNTLWPLYHNTIIKPTRWRGDFDSIPFSPFTSPRATGGVPKKVVPPAISLSFQRFLAMPRRSNSYLVKRLKVNLRRRVGRSQYFGACP